MVVVEDHQQREPSMSEITIGLDLAKNIFQVHGVDETGTAVVAKRLRRSQVIGFFAGLPLARRRITGPAS
jgi:transposase